MKTYKHKSYGYCSQCGFGSCKHLNYKPKIHKTVILPKSKNGRKNP